MSLMFPEYLSGGGKKPWKPSQDLPPESGLGSVPPEATTSSPPLTQKSPNAGPTMERGEYEAELGAEAGVWKVYVKESDRADAELVDGWNKSLDVIIVFAPVFSVVSAVFLMESSQKLQTDPANVTAQTLLAISQTLSILVNSSQSTPDSAPSINLGSFSPPRTMVAVNILWYLSLSLSLATSLLAMLAKDWCHSFIAGRTGHPHGQAIRRQQKWMMIEKWKMKELMVVLPSLVHLSLLLFAIGLCIYLWSINPGVGIPVVCITGATLAFYLWSSVTASIIEYFPYTTIISRFLRSDWRKIMTTSFASTRNLFSFLVAELSRICKVILIAIARGTSAALGKIWRSNVLGWFPSLEDRLLHWRNSLSERADKATETLPMHSREDRSRNQDNFTTPALHWLVTTSEDPRVVDTAFQAFSVANPPMSHKPLEKYNAGTGTSTSERLASGNVYNRDGTHVSSDVRWLSFHGTRDLRGTTALSNAGATSELEATIGNMQAPYDNQVAQLVEDGKFIPSVQNLEAFHIGSSVVSYTLRVLNGFESVNNSPLETVLQMLEDHYFQRRILHPAALKSLFNTFNLLSISTTDPRLLFQLINQLVILTRDSDLLPPDPTNPDDSTREALRIAYILAQSLQQRALGTGNNPGSSRLIFAGEMAEHIAGCHSMSTGDLVLQTLSQVLQIWDHPDVYSVRSSFEGLQTLLSRTEDIDPERPWILNSGAQTLDRFFCCAIPRYFAVLADVYGSSGSPVPDPSARVYLFSVQVMFSTQSTDLRTNCYRFLSRSPFPRLSLELVETIEKQNIIPLLDQTSSIPTQELQIVAISLLWLLSALESYAPPGTDAIRDRLRSQLQICTSWSDLDEMKRALGRRVFDFWQEYDRGGRTGNFDMLFTRVLECVVESGDHAAPRTEDSAGEYDHELKEQINDRIREIEIESSLRGLVSFTAYPNYIQPISEQEISQPGPHRIIDMVDGSGLDVSPP